MASKKLTIIGHGNGHAREALQDVAAAAKYFVPTAPGPTRIEAEGCPLFEVLFNAHIVLCLTRTLHRLDGEATTRGKQAREFRVLENTLTRARANLATSQQVLTHSLVTKLGDRPNRTYKAQAASKSVERPLAPVLPFRKPK